MPPEAASKVRQGRVRARFPEWDVDALLFSDPKSVRYLSGFAGGEGFLLLTEGEAVLLVDGRFTTEARESADATVFEIRDPLEGIAACVRERNLPRAGFDAAFLPASSYLSLAERLPAVSLVPLTREIAGIRAVKEAVEIEAIRRAAAVTDRALAGIREAVAPGVREKDLARELEILLRREGAEAMAFPVIVATGPNAARPHATPGDGVLVPGGAVLVDCGAVVDGYCADASRTFLTDGAPADLRDGFSLVREAQERAVAAVRAGAACRDVDRAARAFLEEKGYGALFPHGTGHGVGLDVHEDPRFNTRSDAVLEAGMVMTVEPGIYLPGRWGVRIEDTVLVTEKGCEALTKAPKE